MCCVSIQFRESLESDFDKAIARQTMRTGMTFAKVAHASYFLACFVEHFWTLLALLSLSLSLRHSLSLVKK